MLKTAYNFGYQQAIKEAGAAHVLIGAGIGAGLGLGAGSLLNVDSPGGLALLGGLGALGGAGVGVLGSKPGTLQRMRGTTQEVEELFKNLVT